MSEMNPARLSTLANAIAVQIEQARRQVHQAVNTAMVQSYWEIGRLIVEDEQQGQQRAEYGKQQLQLLSKTLTERLG
jgi:F0F1-type ATP synthase membrane subunit b/b'